MFERLRRAFAEIAGTRTAFPPPTLEDRERAADLCVRLAAFLKDAPDRYRSVFLEQRPLRVGRDERPLFDACASAGLVSGRGAAVYEPCVRLFPFFGRFVATDLLTYREPDQVFSLMFEQVFLVRNMDVRPDDDVLELCLGSAANALAAADRARSVAGTEISARALAFARANEALAPGAVPLDLREGSLFDPLEPDRRFDLILVNPPFELVPEGEDWFLHSHGGEDGLAVVRDILAEAPGRLTPEGRVEMITWSPGSADRALLPELFRAAFPEHRITVRPLDSGPIEAHAEPFRRSPAYAAWIERLAAQGLTHVHFLHVRSEPGDKPGIEFEDPGAEIDACHAIADDWLL